MTRTALSLTLCWLLVLPLPGEAKEAVHTDWKGLQKHVGSLKRNESVRVTLRSGKPVRTTLREIREEGLVVESVRDTAQWDTAKGLSLIPRAEVSALRLTGRRGKARIWGTLIGLGAGAGAGAAIAAGTSDVTEGYFPILRPVLAVGLAGIGALVGYLVGRGVDQGAPEFVLIP